MTDPDTVLIVVMGVSGCGKTTIGRKLAEVLRAPFVEADDFHSEHNKRKMASGQPLSDADRAPWIEALSDHVETYADQYVVLACSALTPFVQRFLLDRSRRRIRWVLLQVDEGELRRRMTSRDHFMPVDLLESQLAALTIPDDALLFDAMNPVEPLVDEIVSRLGYL